MNVIFICVIVLDKMFFHMLNLCWFKHKKIFECFRCFWKVLCFYKNWKILKTVLPCFGNLVAGHPSCMPQLWARESVLATCLRVEGPVISARNSLASETSSREKHLANFFKTFGLKCFGGWPWRLTSDLYQSRKTRVLHLKTIFKIVDRKSVV